MASTLSAALPITQVAFIDNNLPDLHTLLEGMPQGVEVHLLEHAQDGLAQIAATLQGRSGIQVMHLLSHGAPGSLQLGSATVDRAALARYSGELQTLTATLAEDSELLIYGCEVAAGHEGRLFVDALMEITGLKVAAATHKVGAAELGGDGCHAAGDDSAAAGGAGLAGGAARAGG
jgi:large repetitive protein